MNAVTGATTPALSPPNKSPRCAKNSPVILSHSASPTSSLSPPTPNFPAARLPEAPRRREAHCRRSRNSDRDRLRDYFGHVLRTCVGKIDNLMTAACAGRDDLAAGRLVVHRLDEKLGDLHGKFVFLGERTERTGHAAALCLQQVCFAAR